MQTTHRPTSVRSTPEPGRRFGYALAIGINIVMFWIVHNVLDWGWPSFITEDWSRVRGIIQTSIVVTILVNAAFLAFDPKWFKGLGEALTGFVSLIATFRVFTVYPFDFSGYTGPWDLLARMILVVAIVGTVIGVVANLLKAARAR